MMALLGELTMSELLHPTFVAKNKKGEVIFSVKKKRSMEHEKLYYLFEIHLDKADSNLQRQRMTVAWKLIKSVAKWMKIPLFNVNEIASKISGKINEIRETGLKDVTVEVLDHASQKICYLTVGIKEEC